MMDDGDDLCEMMLVEYSVAVSVERITLMLV
jgi:hypothetical protein